MSKEKGGKKESILPGRDSDCHCPDYSVVKCLGMKLESWGFASRRACRTEQWSCLHALLSTTSAHSSATAQQLVGLEGRMWEGELSPQKAQAFICLEWQGEAYFKNAFTAHMQLSKFLQYDAPVLLYNPHFRGRGSWYSASLALWFSSPPVQTNARACARVRRGPWEGAFPPSAAAGRG